jgi:hypothetical protein
MQEGKKRKEEKRRKERTRTASSSVRHRIDGSTFTAVNEVWSGQYTSEVLSLDLA